MTFKRIPSQYSTINNLGFGRSVDETKRVLQAIQYIQNNPDEVWVCYQCVTEVQGQAANVENVFGCLGTTWITGHDPSI